MSTDDQLLVRREEEEDVQHARHSPIASTSQLTTTTSMTTTTKRTTTSTSDGEQENKYYGLAVTMDGLEEEPNVDESYEAEVVDEDDEMMDMGGTGTDAGTSRRTAIRRQDLEEAAQILESRRQSQLRKQNKFTKASVLIPPENFAIVEDGLYRSVSWSVTSPNSDPEYEAKTRID